MVTGPGRDSRIALDDLLRQARDIAGLDDFGDDWFLQPLAKLVEMVNADAGIPSKDAGPVQQIVSSLVDRLRMVRYLQVHPEARDEKVEVAGFIIGWPRGGSTLLQRLLAASPQLTSSYWWELLNPLPHTDDCSDDSEARKQLALEIRDAMYEKWPKMKSQHPLNPFDVDEEVMLFDRTFLSIMWAGYFYLPSYMGWLNEQDQRRAYEEVLLWLKIIAHQRSERVPRKWILKSPQHLLAGGLRYALDAMPDAKAIMTHRPLQKVATSYASIIETTLAPTSSTYDPKVFGREVIRMFGACVDHLAEVRSEPEYADRFIDVRFEDTFERPVETFSEVLQQMGLQVTDADIAAAERWMAANGRETHPPHKYAPEDYGMTSAEIDNVFANYHRTYLRGSVAAG